MGRRSFIFLRRYTDSQQAQEKKLYIISNQRNANQNHNNISPHTYQNGYHQKVYKQQTPERMWRKKNPLTLLVGL